MKRVLVTGAAGFIGASLSARLRDCGYEIIGIDNYCDYYPATLKVDRVKHLHLPPVYLVDIIHKEALSRFIKSAKPDIVVHLAAMAGVRYSMKNPSIYHKVNIDGTQNVIDACKENGIEKVVYASTSSVCAGIEQLPWREDEPVLHQISPYGYTKFVNECQFKMSGLNNIGLRFFTVYGPWGRPDMALYDFTKNILNREKIKLYNYGNMKRDFTYIDDIVKGVQIVMENDSIPSNEIFNIGNTQQVTLKRFVEAIETATGKKADIEYIEHQAGDCLETQSDVSKLVKYGYEPSVDIEEGVASFVDWYTSYHK
jgi:UDP-glucuronate 4-epimerase